MHKKIHRCGFALIIVSLLFSAWSNPSIAQQLSQTNKKPMKQNDAEQAQSQRGFGSSSLLDGLLENKTPPTKAFEPSESTSRSEKNLIQPADQATLPQRINIIADGMQSASEQMSAPKLNRRSQSDVLAIQDQVLKELDQLFNMLSMQSRADSTDTTQNNSQTKSSAGSEATNADEQGTAESNDSKSGEAPTTPPMQSEENKATGESMTNSGSDSESGSPDSSSDRQNSDAKANGVATGLPTGETVVDLLDSIEQSGQANWGKLPQRLREKLSNSKSFVIPKGYEEAVREYYKYLNEAVAK